MRYDLSFPWQSDPRSSSDEGRQQGYGWWLCIIDDLMKATLPLALHPKQVVVVNAWHCLLVDNDSPIHGFPFLAIRATTESYTTRYGWWIPFAM